MKSTLMAAAVSGILVGAALAHAEPANGGKELRPSSDASQLDGSKHGCKGQNACKGQGGCKTDKHGCKGQNACKGQGGCKG